MPHHHRMLDLFDVSLPKYGARGDGHWDDGPAIQSAIQDAINARGGTVYLPAGTYVIDTPVVVTGPNGSHAHQYVNIKGEGWGGTQIVPGTGATGAAMITVQSDLASAFTHFFRFEDLLFDSGTQHGNPGNAAWSAIKLVDVSHFQIVGCTFAGFQVATKSVIDTLRCAWGQLHENNFVDNELGTICINLAAPDADNPTFGHFISSTLFGPRNSNCIFIGQFSEGTIISGCHFAFHPSGYSIRCEGFEQTIANNYIYPHTTGNPGEGSIGTGPYRQQGIVIDGGYQILIVGNFMENAQENPMLVISNDVARMGGGAQISVLSNLIRETGQPTPEPAGLSPEMAPDPGDGAITVRASAGTGIVIKGNVFQSNYTDHHIKVEDIGNSKRVDIDGNSFEDAPQGTLQNAQATPGRSVFLADGTNDGVRFTKHFDPFQTATREHDIIGTAPAFTSADTTPSVADDTKNYTYNGAAVVITDFDDGHEGQEFFLVPANGNIQISSAGNINFNGVASPYTIPALHAVRFLRAGGLWHMFVS